MTTANSDIHTSSAGGASRDRRRCDEIMTRNVITAQPSMTLQQVAVLMRDGDMGAIPVADETGNLLGIITDRDIVIRALAEGLDPTATAVDSIMTTEIYSARPRDFVFEAIRLMREKQVRRVPVIDETGKLQGILAMADIALEMEDEREIAETLEDISSGAAFWRKGV